MYRKQVHLHFMGIGGIGMSGIAKILKAQGYLVSGCDLECDQKSVRELIELDIPLCKGHAQELCARPDIDILVHSSAIMHDHPEVLAARERGIPVITRALMLAEIMRTKFSIAVAGSHGKTTTTSMIAHLLIEAGLNPTVVIGGHLKNLATNAQLGGGDFLVAEADESDRSLLNLQATLAVLTNISLEHLDTYKDLEDIKNTFRQFLNNLPFYGKAVVCIDDPIIRSMLPMPHMRVITYALSPDADYYAEDIELNESSSSFMVYHRGNQLGRLSVPMPGRHNVLNALAAVAMVQELELPFTIIQEIFPKFGGIERRFSYNGSFNGVEVFDDYGHHPKEILNTLLVARKRAHRKLHVVFQPHRYTRTYHLWQDFINTFLQSKVDSLTITDIYPASEQPIPGITSERLVQELISYNPTIDIAYIPLETNFDAILQRIKAMAQPGDLVLLLGAGKVNKLSAYLLTPETTPASYKEPHLTL